jgi:hypothetical protein
MGQLSWDMGDGMKSGIGLDRPHSGQAWPRQAIERAVVATV